MKVNMATKELILMSFKAQQAVFRQSVLANLVVAL